MAATLGKPQNQGANAYFYSEESQFLFGNQRNDVMDFCKRDNLKRTLFKQIMSICLGFFILLYLEALLFLIV